ncbi:MAG: hypothetical protein HYZ25_01290 [Chloroflexi bacterium]|nr:hypothetical protein [Chloroflexota bacterium]
MFECLVIPLVLLFSVIVIYSQRERVVGKRIANREFNLSLFIILAVFLLFSILSSLRSDSWWSDSLTLLFVFLTISSWISLFALTIKKQRAGEILLDMGRSPDSLFTVSLGVLNLILFLFIVFLEKETILNSIKEQIRWFFMLSSILVTIISRLRRMLFTETGFFWWNLIRYENIASYSWEYDKPNVLSLVLKKRIWFQGVINIPVPMELKNTVKMILMGKVDSQKASL